MSMRIHCLTVALLIQAKPWLCQDLCSGLSSKRCPYGYVVSIIKLCHRVSGIATEKITCVFNRLDVGYMIRYVKPLISLRNKYAYEVGLI